MELLVTDLDAAEGDIGYRGHGTGSGNGLGDDVGGGGVELGGHGAFIVAIGAHGAVGQDHGGTLDAPGGIDQTVNAVGDAPGGAYQETAGEQGQQGQEAAQGVLPDHRYGIGQNHLHGSLPYSERNAIVMGVLDDCQARCYARINGAVTARTTGSRGAWPPDMPNRFLPAWYRTL